MRRTYYLLIAALVIVLVGSLIAYGAQTSGGTITIQDVRFTGTNGTQMSGLLYIPPGVTNENPAPGVLAIHGYINSRETQDGFAIEFARRGYVTLALDQTGHGYSDSPAFANGFGGPDGLAYLHSLDIVDDDNIGISGHSMGGGAVAIAAGVYPDGYRSIILEGSSTGTFGAPDGTAEFPRNLALIFSEWDEFAQLMWGANTAPEIVNTEKLQTLFGTTEPVEVERLYGSIEDGTARILYMPRTTHPGDHISYQAIAQAIGWFNQTLEGANDLDPYDQVWYWREIGGFIALIGMILFMFPMGALLLQTAFFKELTEPLPEFKGLKGGGWWIGAALLVAIPTITYFWFQNQARNWFPVGSFWPQQITTGLVVWAVGNGLISLVLFALWHFFLNKQTGATTDNYALTWDGKLNWTKIGKSLLLAICILAPAYLLLILADQFFKIDFRLWVLAFKPMSVRHFGIALAYLPFFGFFFLMLSTVLAGQLRRVDAEGKPISLRNALLINVALLIVGFVVLLLIQYVPLLTGGTMPLAEPLLSIVAFQLVPLMAIVALLLTYFLYKTGRVYTGAFLIAMLISWYVIAGQAIQFAF
jgi:pimeloyl-ACP methyl ester carboxylesterase